MYILIDIGGTNTRVAKTTDKETFGEPIIFPTPQNFEEWLTQTKSAIETLAAGEKVLSIVAGMAGSFTGGGTTIFKSPHLPQWDGINMQDKLGGPFSCNVHLENDCAIVGLGEAVFGSGKGHDIAVYITISTGVGGVRIVDGKVDRNKFGFEMGHQIVNKDIELEYYIAGSSHEKRYGMPSKEVKDPELWKEVNHYTGVMVANTIMYWSPSVIVLGGPVMNDINLDEVKIIARKYAFMCETMPEIVRSSLGGLGGLYGGMAYLKSKD